MVKTNNIYWAFSEASVRKPCLAKSQGFGAIHSAHTSADDPICICVSKCPDRRTIGIAIGMPSVEFWWMMNLLWKLIASWLSNESPECGCPGLSRGAFFVVNCSARDHSFCLAFLLFLWVTVSPPRALSLSGDWGARLECLSFLGAWPIKLLVGAPVCTRWRGTVSSWLSLIILELLLFCCAPKRVKRCGLQFGRTFFVPPRPGPVDYACGIGPFSSHLASLHTITTMLARTKRLQNRRLLFTPINQHPETKSHKKHKNFISFPFAIIQTDWRRMPKKK